MTGERHRYVVLGTVLILFGTELFVGFEYAVLVGFVEVFAGIAAVLDEVSHDD